ncbi:hypothetical protein YASMINEVIRUS_284 [Yasminevirus sp. GU-2018]|uniref:Uncharacterized protein n=1 Tax=Yasminevirus sp. GU-2018 TaxID=2420051 RepID=A0A5K0U8H5_9VIRU|nr:hypothetical protein YASMINEVIRUS_284 [Yasminevirus sp. GU-2018]
MSDIGIKGLITKNVDEIDSLVKMFIKSSLNIREGIAYGDDPDICMLSLIRDTYMCTLLLRYVGLMTIVHPDPKWGAVDNRIIEYIQDYYSNEKFKNKLIELYEHYLQKYEKAQKQTQTDYDYCKFLDKMIHRGETPKKGIETKKMIRMTENKIFNVMNVNPVVKISKSKFRSIPPHFEIKGDDVLVHLTQANYYDLLDSVDDYTVLHNVEAMYTSRTANILTSFSKLVALRQLLAEQSGSQTYFKHVNYGKNDTSETLKDFLTELNNKLDSKIRNEISRVYQNYSMNTRGVRGDGRTDLKKMQRCDVTKYVRSKRSNFRFEISHVMNVVFSLLGKYFNIKVEKTSDKGWSDRVVVYNMIDGLNSADKQKNGGLLGRLFVDTVFDENKKVSDPISIRLSDKMRINQTGASGTTCSEVALLANYLPNKGLTYNEVVLLFREFGYVVNSVCYESRVGLINYDDESSNYIPALMECIAWDHDTIKLIVGSADHTIIDHIEMSREVDMCYNIKMKCANAKFDHLLHNSEPLLKIIKRSIDTKGDANDEIVETYRGIFGEVMNPVSNMIDTNIKHIDPLTIIQEINGSQGVLYSNLINEIFAYATFWIIKNRSTAKDNTIVSEFRKTVLSNGVVNYRELIRNFLKYADVNCFTLYIKNVIKLDIIDDYVTEDTNCFEEGDDTGDDTSDDKEAIIQINRV